MLHAPLNKVGCNGHNYQKQSLTVKKMGSGTINRYEEVISTIH